VRNGSFVAGQFSFNGAPFPPGVYPIEISLSADPETATVEQIRAIGTVVFAATVKVPGHQETYQTTTSTLLPQKAPPVSNWKTVEADNGAWFAIDMNSITPWSTGGAYAIICAADGNTCPLLNMSRVLFDCRGHYSDIDHGGTMPAPPRSVIGALAAIACGSATGAPRQ
jgi:hypothetical protein